MKMRGPSDWSPAARPAYGDLETRLVLWFTQSSRACSGRARARSARVAARSARAWAHGWHRRRLAGRAPSGGSRSRERRELLGRARCVAARTTDHFVATDELLELGRALPAHVFVDRHRGRDPNRVRLDARAPRVSNARRRAQFLSPSAKSEPCPRGSRPGALRVRMAHGPRALRVRTARVVRGTQARRAPRCEPRELRACGLSRGVRRRSRSLDRAVRHGRGRARGVLRAPCAQRRSGHGPEHALRAVVAPAR